MKAILDLSTAKLKQILAIKTQIERLQSQLTSLAGGASAPSHEGQVIRRRRPMSAAARKKISLAAKARWAKVHAAKAK